MPVETKKVLWTVFSVGAFLVIVLGVLLVAFYPKPGAEYAPLALGLPEARGSAADRYTRPVGSAPLPEALPAQTPATDSAPVVVVPYGEKPEPGSLVPLPAAGASGTAATATIATPAASAASVSDDPAIKRTYAPASGTSPKPSVVVTPESKPAGVATASTSTKPAASTGAAAPTPVAAAPAKSAYVDEFWIQAGSFSSRTRAEDLQALLKEKGLSSTIEARDAASGVVYRVRIGPWDRKDVADGWLETVRKVDGCADAYVSKVTRKT